MCRDVSHVENVSHCQPLMGFIRLNPSDSTPRNNTLPHRETILRDIAGAGVPDAIPVFVLDAMSNRLAQGAQAERLADDESVQRQCKNQRLALGLLEHLLELVDD